MPGSRGATLRDGTGIERRRKLGRCSGARVLCRHVRCNCLAADFLWRKWTGLSRSAFHLGGTDTVLILEYADIALTNQVLVARALEAVLIDWDCPDHIFSPIPRATKRGPSSSLSPTGCSQSPWNTSTSCRPRPVQVMSDTVPNIRLLERSQCRLVAPRGSCRNAR